MATTGQMRDGMKALMQYGERDDEEIRFEHDICYAGDAEDADPELIAAMEKAGWQVHEEDCFTLGLG